MTSVSFLCKTILLHLLHDCYVIMEREKVFLTYFHSSGFISDIRGLRAFVLPVLLLWFQLALCYSMLIIAVMVSYCVKMRAQ